MAHFSACVREDGYAIVDDETGDIAIINGRPQEGLDSDAAEDILDLISCIEGEPMLDLEDRGDTRRPAAIRRTSARHAAGGGPQRGYLPWRSASIGVADHALVHKSSLVGLWREWPSLRERMMPTFGGDAKAGKR